MAEPTREALLDCIQRFVADYYEVCGFIPHSIFGDTEIEWMVRWKREDPNGWEIADRGRRLLEEAGIIVTPPQARLRRPADARRNRPFRVPAQMRGNQMH